MRTTVIIVGAGLAGLTLARVLQVNGVAATIYEGDADGRVRGYVALTEPEEWMRSIDFSDPSAGLRQVSDEFDGWSPLLTAFVTGSDAEPWLRPIYALPVGLSWHRVPGVTLVGDAAHLMSPFAGEGANLAMYDGADLASRLVDHHRRRAHRLRGTAVPAQRRGRGSLGAEPGDVLRSRGAQQRGGAVRPLLSSTPASCGARS